MNDQTVTVRFLFADSGSFHHEDMVVPASSVTGYGRLIDGLQEDPEFLKGAHVDLERLCAAWILQESD